jgi:hypothetical protein
VRHAHRPFAPVWMVMHFCLRVFDAFTILFIYLHLFVSIVMTTGITTSLYNDYTSLRQHHRQLASPLPSTTTTSQSSLQQHHNITDNGSHNNDTTSTTHNDNTMTTHNDNGTALGMFFFTNSFNLTNILLVLGRYYFKRRTMDTRQTTQLKAAAAEEKCLKGGET